MNSSELLEWLEVAKHDSDTVHLLIRENGHADIIIYHIHQAVEKLIKALLIKSNAAFEKSHRLDKLLGKALLYYPDLITIKDQILEIDYYMPKLRYPAGEKIEFATAMRIYKLYLSIEEQLWNNAGKDL
jgi:HEPN domain-containing protein